MANKAFVGGFDYNTSYSDSIVARFTVLAPDSTGVTGLQNSGTIRLAYSDNACSIWDKIVSAVRTAVNDQSIIVVSAWM